MSKVAKKKSNLIWTVLSVLIAVLSIWAVTSQSATFSTDSFIAFLGNASLPWVLASLAAMLCFILFEALSIRTICKTFGHRFSVKRGVAYSSADLYFSAITPSATGGQPVCAMFMIKDGIPGAVAAVVLLINLTMYFIAFTLIGLLSFIFHFDVFLNNFSTASQILIVIGFIAETALTLFMILLLVNGKLLNRICFGIFNLLVKIKVIRKVDKYRPKLEKMMADYRESADMALSHSSHSMLIKAFIYNLLQCVSKITVTAFTFLAVSSEFHLVDDIWSLQNFVAIGSNCIPIPGAMGIADYLLLDGFGSIMSEAMATNLEILSRSASFYTCTILCGVLVAVKYLTYKVRRSK